MAELAPDRKHISPLGQVCTHTHTHTYTLTHMHTVLKAQYHGRIQLLEMGRRSAQGRRENGVLQKVGIREAGSDRSSLICLCHLQFTKLQSLES